MIYLIFHTFYVSDQSRLTRLSEVLEPNLSTTVQKLWAYIVNVQTITI